MQDVIQIVLGIKDSRSWSAVMVVVWLLILLWVWRFPAWPSSLPDFTNHPHRMFWIAFSAFAAGVQLTKIVVR